MNCCLSSGERWSPMAGGSALRPSHRLALRAAFVPLALIFFGLWHKCGASCNGG